jgi:fructuronate reductase
MMSKPFQTVAAPRARLSEASLQDLPQEVARPSYARAGIATGIVHFGPGAFHRAHQAAYFEALLPRDPRWGIAQVSLRSTSLRDALVPQDRLYTLVELGAQKRLAVIGAATELLVAQEDRARVLALLAAPATKAVTITVTEHGYCQTREGALDLAREEIVHDLAHPREPAGLIGWIAEGLRARREAGLAPFATISCDNLPDNGGRLKRSVIAFANALDAELAKWIEDEAVFPRTMVDSIVPATGDALREDVRAILGVEDAWPVQRESFMQWVIEDLPGSPARDWTEAGVTVTKDVTAYERAKLRLLNGAHTTMAYVGSINGIATIREAMATPALAHFVERLMREDIMPSLPPPADFSLPAYIDAVLERFRNPAMRHLTAQIAWDGSQKLGPRLLGTIAEAMKAGRPIGRLCVPLAAWMLFIRMKTARDEPITDPLRDRLKSIALDCTGHAETDVPKFLALDAVFPRRLAVNDLFATAIAKAYDGLAAQGLGALE